MKDYFTPKAISYNFRRNDVLCVPKVKTTTCGMKPLRFLGSQTSNSLPNDIKSSQYTNQCKALIKTAYTQYNTIQYNTIQYNTIQYNTIHSQCILVLYHYCKTTTITIIPTYYPTELSCTELHFASTQNRLSVLRWILSFCCDLSFRCS